MSKEIKANIKEYITTKLTNLEGRMESLEQKMDKLLKKKEAKEEKKKKKPPGKDKWSRSTIMTVKQVKLLKNWIKPNELAKVKLILMYRGSQDGFTPGAFHNKCDNAGPTVSVIESHLGKVFGGFTTISWTNNTEGGYASDPKAFTFSLSNKMKCCISDPGNSKYAVCYGFAYGPSFGYSHDFRLNREFNKPNNCGSYPHGTYQMPSDVIDPKSFYSGAQGDFSVKEVEVYGVDVTYNYYSKK